MSLNPQLHVDPATIRDPSLAPYIAASTIGKLTASEFDDADEVLSTDTAEALREAAKKRADTYDEEDPQSGRPPVTPVMLNGKVVNLPTTRKNDNGDFQIENLAF